MRLDLKAIVAGSCDQPRLEGRGLPKGTQLIAIFHDCERTYTDRVWFGDTGKPMNALLPGPETKNADARPMESPTMELSSESPSLWSKVSKSPWFWGGLIAIAGATAVVIQNQNQTPAYAPTNNVR